MYELVEKILQAVSFIAIGGAAALMFFVVFAQSIVGSKKTQIQLERIIRQIEQMNRLLSKLADQTDKNPPEDKLEKEPRQ